MTYRNFERIIKSLRIRLNQADHMQILKSVCVKDYKNADNMLVIVNRGRVVFGKGNEQVVLGPGDIFFVPESYLIPVTYGSEEPIHISNNKFINYGKQYLEVVDDPDAPPSTKMLSFISFNASAFDVIGFFGFIDVPVFQIQGDAQINQLIDIILKESTLNKIGKKQVLNLNTKYLVICLIRYMLERNLFLDKIMFKVDALQEPRLLATVSYIKENLDGDLSNKAIAREINLSPQYVGQYIRNITKGMLLQDWVATMRMSKAGELVKMSPMRIGDIGKKTGFKDKAYFSRKFKEVFGITAKKMRDRHQNES